MTTHSPAAADRSPDPAPVVPAMAGSAGHRGTPPTDRVAWGRHLRAAYEDGATIRGLAADTGWSYGYIHRALTEAGTVLRPRGGIYPARAPQREP